MFCLFVCLFRQKLKSNSATWWNDKNIKKDSITQRKLLLVVEVFLSPVQTLINAVLVSPLISCLHRH